MLASADDTNTNNIVQFLHVILSNNLSLIQAYINIELKVFIHFNTAKLDVNCINGCRLYKSVKSQKNNKI